jgi:hypothetical protein
VLGNGTIKALQVVVDQAGFSHDVALRAGSEVPIRVDGNLHSDWRVAMFENEV